MMKLEHLVDVCWGDDFSQQIYLNEKAAEGWELCNVVREKESSFYKYFFRKCVRSNVLLKNEIIEAIVLEIIKDESEKADVRKYTCTNGFGYSQFERNIAERIVKLFAIPDISNSRELLLAYHEFYLKWRSTVSNSNPEYAVDAFLSNQ